MTPVPRLEVIPPPPSFEPSTYKPFGDEVNRTIDQILSEEVGLESTRDDDWPTCLGGASSNQHKDNEIKESRFFSDGAVPNGVKTTRRTRHVARRSITVVDPASDDDESSVPSDSNEPEIEMNDAGSHHELSGEIDNRVDNEVGNGSPPDRRPENGDVLVDKRKPVNTGGNKALEPGNSDDAFVAEEDVIFACVEPSQRDHLLHYLVSHPFMQNRVQPVQRSTRRHFVGMMRKEAASVGMDEPAIDQLIEYVRKLYLEDLDVQFQPPGQLDDVPFGEEIDDDHPEKARRRKSGKRRRDDSEQTATKRSKRRKESRKSSHGKSTSSLQSALQKDISQRMESSMNDSLLQDNRNGCARLTGGDDKQALGSRTPQHAHSQRFENMRPAAQDVIGLENPHEAEKAIDERHAHTPTRRLNGHPRASEDEILREESHPGRFPEGPDAAAMVAERSHADHEALPTSRARLANVLKDNLENGTQDAVDVLPAQPIRYDTKLNGTYAEILSEPEAVEPNREASLPRSPDNQAGTQSKRQKNANPSRRTSQISTLIDASDNAIRQSPPPEMARKPQAEPTEENSQKHLNWKKKEKKKRKKRRSYLETTTSQHPVDQAQNLPSTSAESSVPVSIPDIRTPTKSPAKFKFADLSPDPAEWSMDF